IARMVKESETHAAEDRKWKEDADTRNEADSLSYQVERQLNELGEKVQSTTRGRAESAIRDLRSKLEQRADAQSIKKLMDELRAVVAQAQQDVAQASQQQQSANPFPNADQLAGAAAGNGNHQGAHRSNSDDDVIDAEYTAA